MSAIYKVTAYDLLGTSIVDGNYYVLTDVSPLQMRRDVGSSRLSVSVIEINTELERLSEVHPLPGKLYYVWETNELWSFNAGWISIIGGNTTFSGYNYNNGSITGVSNLNNILDNNGLLGDGSVVVRDMNRIIKGKLSINNDDNTLIISSFLGGGIVLLPSGTLNERGSLTLDSTKIYNENGTVTESEGKAVFKGDFYVEHLVNKISVETKIATVDELLQETNNIVTGTQLLSNCMNRHETSASVQFTLPTLIVGRYIWFDLTLLITDVAHAITWSAAINWVEAYTFGAGKHVVYGWYDEMDGKWYLMAFEVV